jgi:hypothetical protein
MPGENVSAVARKLKLHIITVQKILDVLEKYDFVTTKEKKGIGRPSKIYFYKGGSLNINLDSLLHIYSKKSLLIREKGNTDVKFSYDVDKEIINIILLGGKKGETIKLSEKAGRFLWILPSPDSIAEEIEKLASRSDFPLIDAILLTEELIKKNVIEVIKK